MAEPKILGRHKYEAPPLEVNLSEEIAGNLRGLKVEGNSSTLLAFLAVRDSSLGYRLRQLDKAIPFMSAEVIIVKIQVTSCLPLVHSLCRSCFRPCLTGSVQITAATQHHRAAYHAEGHSQIQVEEIHQPPPQGACSYQVNWRR